MNENRAEKPALSIPGLLGVLAALLFLTGLSIALAHFYEGPLRVAAALSIAAVKTGLVLIFFMHLRQAGKAVALSFLATVVTLAVFIGLTFADTLYR